MDEIDMVLYRILYVSIDLIYGSIAQCPRRWSECGSRWPPRRVRCSSASTPQRAIARNDASGRKSADTRSATPKSAISSPSRRPLRWSRRPRDPVPERNSSLTPARSLWRDLPLRLRCEGPREAASKQSGQNSKAIRSRLSEARSSEINFCFFSVHWSNFSNITIIWIQLHFGFLIELSFLIKGKCYALRIARSLITRKLRVHIVFTHKTLSCDFDW